MSVQNSDLKYSLHSIFCWLSVMMTLSASPLWTYQLSSACAQPKSLNQASSIALTKRKEALKVAKTEYKLGLADFKAERYKDALQRFVRVYRLNPHPNLVYNMARSFEQLKEYKNAADYYRKYLDISPQAKDREQVEITISTMLRLADDTGERSDLARHQLLRRVGWGSAALGGALILAGSAFGVKALNRADELKGYGSGDSLQDFNSTASQRDQAALFSDLFMISGVAISSLGLYFALRPGPTRQSSAASQLSVSLSPQSLMIQGAF